VVSLHVSSENTFNPNYQGFEESGCTFGVGHELRSGDNSYFRIPHWWNYVDFAEDKVPSPGEWPRLGAPIKQQALLLPLQWNSHGSMKAAFICSYLDAQRAFLLREVRKAIVVDGFGRPFDDPRTNNGESSGFTKRELLMSYKYSLCPENSIAPGYVTEKIPEAFACGTIPIGYVDPQASMDFNEGSFINLYHLLHKGLAEGLLERVLDSQSHSRLLSTPLIKERIKIDSAIDFLKNVVRIASDR